MGANTGSKNTTDGLVMHLDAKSRQSTMRNSQGSNILNDSHNWSIGNGGSSGYGANGSATEQSRALRMGPSGRQAVTWRSTPDATSGADGGWNSSSYSIDTSYTYRWSVWCKRYTSGTGGTFYLGMNPAPIRNDNDSVQGNPYWYCPAISNMVQDRWYLIIGHCFYEGYTGSRHPQSGWWYKDTNNNLVKTDLGFCNCGNEDVRWNPGTTTSMHRSYHFYTTNTASGIEWSAPRVDKLDGSEPTLGEMFDIGDEGWRDLTNNDRSVSWVNDKPTWVADPGYWSFNGTSARAQLLGNEYSFTSGSGVDYSFEVWFRMRTLPTAQYGVNGHILGGENGNDIVMYLNPASGGVSRGIMVHDDSRYDTGHMTSSGFQANQWYQWVAVGNGTNNTISHYINGSLDRANGPVLASQVNRTFSGIKIGYDSRWSTHSTLDIAIIKQYNKQLSANEVATNFAASRKRFEL